MKPEKLREAFRSILTKNERKLLPSSFDIQGNLLIFSRFPVELSKKEGVIAEKIISMHKNIKSVLKKTRQFSGTYRLPKYKIMGGRRKKETEHRENNVRLLIHPEKVYFSVRLGNERKRICSQVKDGERVLVMFSGCAPYALVISKNTKAKFIIGVEINPHAHKYGLKNVEMNKAGNVELINGDVRVVVPKLKGKFDRILMPLPKGAEGFLDLAFKKIKLGGIIHFYDFMKEGGFDVALEKIMEAANKMRKKVRIIRMVKCGRFSPGVFRICVDFSVS